MPWAGLRGRRRSPRHPSRRLMGECLLVHVSRAAISAQFDGPAMWRSTIRLGPGFPTIVERGCFCQPLCSDKVLKSTEPMLVVVRPIIWFPPHSRNPKLDGESCCPFSPGEAPCIVQPDGQREGLCLPGFSKHRTFHVLRQMWQFRKSGEIAG
jgi:hypothetical protein